MRQPKPMWFDVTTANSTTPRVPTTLLLRSKDGSGDEVLEIEYLEEKMDEGSCRQWIERPTFIVHTRYPDNMWHAWGDGYIGTFQTARELGYLNLYEIDDGGVVTNKGTGLPGKSCPTVADLLTGSVKPAVDCVHREDKRSNPNPCNSGDSWCHPGVWAGNPGLGYTQETPVVVYFDSSNIEGEWSSLYSAMSSTVRSFNALEGYCIRNLVVGTTQSLKFIEKYNSNDEADERFDQVQAMESLSNDLDDFVRFTKSALERLKMNNAIEFLGYKNRLMEKLRLGIRLGQGSIIDQVYPAKRTSLWDAYFSNLDMSMQKDMESMLNHPWAFDYEQRHISQSSDYEEIRREASQQLSQSPLMLRNVRPYGYGKLPVVTFISRVKTLNRAILNERQILRYIYWNYEVELRVTDLSENLDVVADTLSDTDVLIGMHQPEWMSAIFLRPGAVTLQLHPFGWRLADGSLLRGSDVENIAHLRRGAHLDWVNPHREFSFFRHKDFRNGVPFRAHPSESGEWSKPIPTSPHQAWLYANTYADLNHLKPYIDVVMEHAGVPKLPGWKIDELRAIRLQIKEQMPENVQKDWVQGNLWSVDGMRVDQAYDEDSDDGGGDQDTEDEGDEEKAEDEYSN